MQVTDEIRRFAFHDYSAGPSMRAQTMLSYMRRRWSMTKSIVYAVALFVIVMPPGSPAVAADNQAERESHDRAQIEKLMWQYVRALDTENAEAYAAAFTPDGQFGSGASAVKGREALKKMINDLRQRAAENEAKSGEKRPAMYHVIANSYLEFLYKDHARDLRHIGGLCSLTGDRRRRLA
jgi:hypothetical protein